MGFGSPFDSFMFNIMPIMGFAIFATVFILFAVFIIRNIRTYYNNSSSPKVTVPARVISKRTHVWGGSGDMASSTSYYATFELENGERLELPVGGSFYGLHAEGDTGMLTHQGTRFYGFERERV